MARQVLPVNFQDDVLNASMNGKRRYMLLQQDDGSYILNDVTSYDTEGSTFGAAQINATNQAVNQSVDKDDVLNTSEEVEANVDEKKVTGALVTKQLISDLGGLTFSQDAEGNWGYKPEGADAVIPFSSGVEFLDSKYTATSGQWLEYTYTVKENCHILVVIGAFGYNNLSLKRNNVDVPPTTKIDNQYEAQTHLYAYSLYCNKGDVLLANSEPGSYNSRSSICMIFKT